MDRDTLIALIKLLREAPPILTTPQEIADKIEKRLLESETKS